MILRGGASLELHPSPDYVSDTIRETGDFYEVAILEDVVRRLDRGTVVDAGAMIGNHTVYLAHRRAGLWIHAFEPVPANVALLRRNVERCTHVVVHELALSDRPGLVQMRLEPGNLGHSLVDGGGRLTVEAATLDSFALRDVVLLKVDVEGHEPQVLAGARETIARWQPLILIEDWRREYADLLPGYRLAAEWEQAHQTFLYEPIAPRA